MKHEDFEWCGDCSVCSDGVDHSDAGFCAQCKEPFHWGTCGGWVDGEHVCGSCEPDQFD